MSTNKKRTVNDANLEASTKTTKKRKINENEKNECESPSTSKNNKKDANNDPSNWSFAFGDNSWVRQSSNASNTSTNDEKTTTNDPSAERNNGNMDSFSQYTGLGFQRVLDDGNKENKDKDKNKNNDDNPWGGILSNSNPDGTFKLNFNWGKWGNDNAKIDLNPSNKVGWASTAKTYDPNIIEEDDKTQKVLDQMTGEQDAGDTQDNVKYTLHCKIYNLEDSKYIERGNGIVKLNTYIVGDENKLKGRILCRRDQTLTTLINASILKEMKFEKTGSYIRFATVVQIQEKKDENGKKEEDVIKTLQGNETLKKENDDAYDNEDDDVMMNTYLLRPLDKTKLDVFLNKIKEIQQQIA